MSLAKRGCYYRSIIIGSSVRAYTGTSIVAGARNGAGALLAAGTRNGVGA
jgi:acetyltransferase-like isoleucine patch superfamily enzyme